VGGHVTASTKPPASRPAGHRATPQAWQLRPRDGKRAVGCGRPGGLWVHFGAARHDQL